MTNTTAAVPPALQRALALLIDAPAHPQIGRGYLDLLTQTEGTPKNTGAVQTLWDSWIGSLWYNNIQVVVRRLFRAWQPPIDWLNIPSGGIVLDVGSGPGNVTAALARAAGPDGLALGVDISEPMLARAVRTQAGPQVGFVRADAQPLPFRDETFDAVTSIAVLHLVPDRAAAVAEVGRVLRPGGRAAAMIPTIRHNKLRRSLPTGGTHIFGEDELGDVFENAGFAGVRTKTRGNIQWVRGTRP